MQVRIGNWSKFILKLEAIVKEEVRYISTVMHAEQMLTDVDFMQDGKTPFLYACIKGNMNIVDLLMWKKANISVRDHVR